MSNVDLSLTNEQLIEHFRNGDDTAFDVLIERMMPMLRTEVARLCENQEDRDDLAQEALMALLRAAEKFSSDGGASFSTFARVCVRNRLLNSLHVLGGQETPSDDAFLMKEVDKGAVLRTDDPDRLLVDREEEKLLLSRLKSRLSDLEYRVLILHLGAYSYREIADILHIEEKAVDNAMQRVRKKLSRFF